MLWFLEDFKFNFNELVQFIISLGTFVSTIALCHQIRKDVQYRNKEIYDTFRHYIIEILTILRIHEDYIKKKLTNDSIRNYLSMNFNKSLVDKISDISEDKNEYLVAILKKISITENKYTFSNGYKELEEGMYKIKFYKTAYFKNFTEIFVELDEFINDQKDYSIKINKRLESIGSLAIFDVIKENFNLDKGELNLEKTINDLYNKYEFNTQEDEIKKSFNLAYRSLEQILDYSLKDVIKMNNKVHKKFLGKR